MESLIIVLYQMDDGSRFAILVEDKVDAPLQPQQLERYVARADRDTKDGQYADFAVMLCTPRAWNRATPLPNAVSRLFFEDIAQFLERQQSSLRARYRAEFLKTAAAKAKNAWERRPDVATDEFWSAAYEVAAREYAILEMKDQALQKMRHELNSDRLICRRGRKKYIFC